MGRRKVNDKEQKNKPKNDGLNTGIEILNKSKKVAEEKRAKRVGKRSPGLDTKSRQKAKDQKKHKGESDSFQNTNSNLRLLVYSILILVVVFVSYFIYNYKSILGINPVKEATVDDNRKIDIASTESDIYMQYNNELLVCSNQYIRMYNSKLDQTFEYQISEMFIPSIYIQDGYMAVVNKSNGRIYLFRGKNEILEKQIDGSIKNVFLDSNGNMAIEYSITGYKRIIGVYNSGGENIYNVNINGSGINKIILLNNARKLVISQADTSSLTFGTIIKIADENSKDNIKDVAKFDNNLLIDMAVFGSDIIMLLDSKIQKYNMSSGIIEEVDDFSQSQVSFVRISDDYYYKLEEVSKFDENDSKSYILNSKRYNQSQIFKISLQNIPKNIYNTGLLNYLLYNDKIQIINKWGIVVKNINITNMPKGIVVFNNEKSVALIYANKINIVNI